MLPDARSLSLGLTLLITACSNLPPKTYPGFVEQDLEASFVVDEHGRIVFPATTGDLVVHRLELQPQPLGEHFGSDGERWFTYAPGTAVTLRAWLRSYDDGPTGKSLDAALQAAHHVARNPHRDQ
ncbi:MAG: hypothetical protein R3F29_04535 [Planctomycetota bacterium]